MFGEVEMSVVELFDTVGNYCVGQDYSGVSLLYGCGG